MPNPQDSAIAAQDAQTNAQRHDQRQGDTHWSQVGGEKPAAPRQPDESASGQLGEGRQADAPSSQTDTDRGPVTDQVYNESVVEGHRVGDDETVAGERDPKKSTSSRHR
ncbi:hypothetical protein [Xylophilus sp. GOD-11R]|uniref:hypothetical protein n=1 Tax=Xylophilus sp. GOD-11R TaxID=3089814 RepID=UPI00298BED57|nr:hypothetical protein [Xylophilus sp. GOD-11R]WPB57459.1 hypothetical protein R9X41_02045 [Xylophilus sp. GOD-11R]